MEGNLMNGKPCFYCGAGEFMEMTDSGNIELANTQSGMLKSKMHYVVCARCGTVNRTYIANISSCFGKTNKPRLV